MAKNRGKEIEKEFLRRIAAMRQPNSGAIPGFPNDGRKGKYLIEVKSSSRSSIGIKKKWLDVLYENAILSRRKAALVILFTNQEWVAMPLVDFEHLSSGWSR